MTDKDKAIIEQTIRTNLNLIKAINRNPYTEGLVFKKDLLARGINTLQVKTNLSEIERLNLQRFNDKYSMEIDNE